jgi:hypothetical protein
MAKGPTNARKGPIAAKKAINPKQAARFNTQVGGAYENRAPLDAWTKLAHALFQSNEATFYN